MSEILPEGWRELVEQAGPAIVGTAVSMFFTRGAFGKRLVQCAVGVPFAMYMAPSVAGQLERWGWGVGPEGAGVLTGVFGLALVSYVFELSRALNLGPMIREWIAARLGVKIKPDTLE